LTWLSRRRPADHSVLVVAKPDNRGRIWIVDVVGGTFSPSQFVTIILQQAVLHRPSRIWLDNQPGSKVYQEYLNVRAAQVSLRVAVDIVKSERQKDAKYIRIAALESQFKQRRLFLCAGIHDFERLEEEFTQFPRGRHDDRPDAIALAVNQLNQSGFCRAPLKPLPDPHSWMVQAVLDDAVEVKPSSSLCGEGFV
jgi:predicted phage terminase large subunit-like protein